MALPLHKLLYGYMRKSGCLSLDLLVTAVIIMHLHSTVRQYVMML